MTSLEQVYNSVLDDCHSDTPRLAYADACEAFDEGRARLIRLQVEAVQQERANDLTRASHLFVESYGLLREPGNSERWAGVLGSRVKRYEFHRGFVEKIEIDAADFIAHADELYRVAPIRRLSLKRVMPVI